MRKLFYIALLLWAVFEIANIYFIMPLPYSQRVRSIDVAYFLYAWRWIFRAAFGIAALSAVPAIWRSANRQRGLALTTIVATCAIAYVANVVMSADHIFIAPMSVSMRPIEHNVVEPTRLVVGVDLNGDARAYPVQFLGYHHQVRDTVGGKPVLVSFCTVCRTGRVFSPLVDGHVESFRLVGMDHFNAMFEDRATGSWWRQATGEAIAGKMKGTQLDVLPSVQVTLAEWLALHPKSLIMQPDSALRDKYSKSFNYEQGLSRGGLTGTDTASWHDKSWVVGIAMNGESKAFDWNRLRKEGAINDVVGRTPVVLVLHSDGMSFFAFARPDTATHFSLRADSLVSGAKTYALDGGNASEHLTPVLASQEFWHSWRTFHPDTRTY